MQDKTRQSLPLFLADWFTALPFKMSMFLESLFPLNRDQPPYMSSNKSTRELLSDDVYKRMCRCSSCMSQQSASTPHLTQTMTVVSHHLRKVSTHSGAVWIQLFAAMVTGVERGRDINEK